jgi:hypothetical protein
LSSGEGIAIGLGRSARLGGRGLTKGGIVDGRIRLAVLMGRSTHRTTGGSHNIARAILSRRVPLDLEALLPSISLLERVLLKSSNLAILGLLRIHILGAQLGRERLPSTNAALLLFLIIIIQKASRTTTVIARTMTLIFFPNNLFELLAQIGHLVHIGTLDGPRRRVSRIRLLLFTLLGLEPNLIILAIVIVPHLTTSGDITKSKHELALFEALTLGRNIPSISSLTASQHDKNIGQPDRKLEEINELVILIRTLDIARSHLARRRPRIKRKPNGNPFLKGEVADDNATLDRSRILGERNGL